MLSIKKLCFDKILKDIDFEVKTGEIVSILGPSGCGKTTLARCIMGLTTPSSGSIHFNNKDYWNIKSYKRNFSIVFQHNPLFPHLNVKENILLGSEKTIIELYDILKILKIQHLMDHNIPNLSGGEQQRISIARALSRDCDLLILDEPFSNLDVVHKASLIEDLKTLLNHHQISTIFISHAYQESFQLSNKVYLMKNGEIIQKGTPQELYNTPQNEWVCGFFGEYYTFDKEEVKFLFDDEREIIARPESFIVSWKSNPDDNNATITKIEFRGPTSLVSFKLKNGREVKTICQNPFYWKVGTMLTLNVYKNATRINKVLSSTEL